MKQCTESCTSCSKKPLSEKKMKFLDCRIVRKKCLARCNLKRWWYSEKQFQ